MTETETRDYLDRLFDLAAAGGPVTLGAPITDDELLPGVQRDLTEAGHPLIPEDHVELLKRANGVLCAGVEFFGVGPDAVTVEGHAPPDLVAANARMATGGDVAHRLVLGRSDLDLYVFDVEAGRYEILERPDLARVQDWPTALDLLEAALYDRL